MSRPRTLVGVRRNIIMLLVTLITLITAVNILMLGLGLL